MSRELAERMQDDEARGFSIANSGANSYLVCEIRDAATRSAIASEMLERLPYSTPFELNSARHKYAAAQAAADKRDADVAARLADQADIDAQLAESTARAKRQEQLVTEMDASLRDLRTETLRNDNAGASPQTPQPATTPPQP